MRPPASSCQFMRRLSVQPEESSDADMEVVEDPNSGPYLPVTRNPDGTTAINIPSHFSLHGGRNNNLNDNSDMDIVENELRKISVASMTSMQSSTSSVTSCSSAPGVMNHHTERYEMSTSCPSTKMLGQSCGMQPVKAMATPRRPMITSRPSFISLCSIVSETSESPAVAQRLLPAPLQVELDFMQRSGIEGDEPTCRSHLPILRCQSDYDINEMDVSGKVGFHVFPKSSKISKGGIVKGIKQLPRRMRKISTEKNRFDIYSVSDETRQQLKQLYVY